LGEEEPVVPGKSRPNGPKEEVVEEDVDLDFDLDVELEPVDKPPRAPAKRLPSHKASEA
jgi:hypothetical protein